MGEISVGTKTDQEMCEFVRSEAERLGVSRSEFLRRLMALYRESRRGEVACPHCGETVALDLRT